jgi:hypothetical protein
MTVFLGLWFEMLHITFEALDLTMHILFQFDN